MVPSPSAVTKKRERQSSWITVCTVVAAGWSVQTTLSVFAQRFRPRLPLPRLEHAPKGTHSPLHGAKGIAPLGRPCDWNIWSSLNRFRYRQSLYRIDLAIFLGTIRKAAYIWKRRLLPLVVQQVQDPMLIKLTYAQHHLGWSRGRLITVKLSTFAFMLF